MYLLVGHAHAEFTSYFEANNMPYFVLRDTKRNEVADEHSLLVDINDKVAVYKAIDALPQVPTCVFAMYEHYIPLAAEINKHLGIEGALSPQSALICTDKVLMREAFAKAPVPISPAYTEVTSLQQAEEFAAEHGFPLILKPANLSKSLLVARCNTLESLRRSYQEITEEAPGLYHKYTDGLEPKFILEVFMPGSVHTVLGFADKDGVPLVADQIVDNVTAHDAGYDDSFIFSRTIPSSLPPSDQRAILECAKQGMRALGLQSCAAHIELILTEDGPRIIEIGARIGGYRTRMYRYASGIDVIAATLAAYRNEEPVVTSTKAMHCRVIEVFPRKKGSLKTIANFAVAEHLPSIVSARAVKEPGEMCGKAAQGFKATAIFVLNADTFEQIEHDYKYIRAHVQVVVED